jgi:UPF0755 protein
MKLFRAAATLIVIAGVVLGGLAAYWSLHPYRGFSKPKFVDIERGMSSRAIGRQLAEAGIVRSPWSFLLVRALHPGAKLQAGEYRFSSAENAWQVFETIRRGQIYYEELTVPEGSNIFDIAALLRNSDTVSPDDFLKAAANPASIHDLDPAAPSLEGYLFPSTYRMTRKTSGAQLCRTMTAEFRRQWSKLPAATPQNVHDVVTLASLIEKETGVPSERPLVAAVFRNRLQKGIPLQCDPTTVYAALLENRYSGVIHRSDLGSANPYNTYTHLGLPPGPITNPGIASLAAALNPAKTSFLYFVAKADGSGGHQFSTTLGEHEKAVASYRRAHE